MLNLTTQGAKEVIMRWVDRVSQLRDIFSSSKDVYGNLLGVDLDDTSVLSILLRNPLGTTRIANAELAGLSANIIVNDGIANSAELSNAIKKMLEKAKMQGLRAAIAMPGSKVVIKQIKLDNPLSDAEAETRAWQEAAKTFPDIVKSLYLDFTQIEEPGTDKNKKYILVLIAARKEDILPRVEGLQQAGLTTKIVDVDYFALERAYTLLSSQLPENHAAKYVAMIDFNPHSILFVVMHEKKAVYFNRQNYPGDILVPIVQRIMDLEVAQTKAKPIVLPTLHAAPMQASETAATIDSLTEEQKSHVVMSIRRVFQSFYVENTGKVIDHILLTGRCALISDLTQHLQKTLGIPVVVGNPFSAIKMGERVNVDRILKLAPAFALSCGLAMRGIPLWI